MQQANNHEDPSLFPKTLSEISFFFVFGMICLVLGILLIYIRIDLFLGFFDTSTIDQLRPGLIFPFFNLFFFLVVCGAITGIGFAFLGFLAHLLRR
ncbi:MAG: hypothetical protein ACFFE8_01960 [Candidatus Heimdallarchaeota archaeon]